MLVSSESKSEKLKGKLKRKAEDCEAWQKRFAKLDRKYNKILRQYENQTITSHEIVAPKVSTYVRKEKTAVINFLNENLAYFSNNF